MRPKWLCDYVREMENNINTFILNWFENCVDVGEEFSRKGETLFYDGLEDDIIIFKRSSGAYIGYTPQKLRGTLKKDGLDFL